MLAQSGQLDAAEDAMRKAVTVAPDDARNHAGLSHILERRGDHAGALHAASRAAELDPQGVHFLRRRDQLLARQRE